jgi:NAD(P)-dependent dehydrogenase (short-subunit alcohol dehydrogenase family)
VSRALVAGAAGGIGRATVRRLCDRGRTVHALDVDAAGLAALPDGVETHAVDATDPNAVAPAVAEAAPDAVAAAVGWYELGAVEDQPADAVGRHLETNVVATHAVVRAALPGLRRRGGRVVVGGAVRGRVTLPYYAGYADALRREVGPRSIDVSLVEPGPVDTGLNRGRPRRSTATPDRRTSRRTPPSDGATGPETAGARCRTASDRPGRAGRPTRGRSRTRSSRR